MVMAVIAGILVSAGIIWPIVNDTCAYPKSAAAKRDLIGLMSAFEAYKMTYNAYPSGKYAQIVSALGGENPSRLEFLMVRPRNLNAGGEFLDPWQTPYRIFFDAAGKPHVYSFGPNRLDDQGRKGSDDITAD